MGLFDSLGNLSPEQTQGLLAAAAQMLQQSGPSRMPTSFGQIAGGGLQAFQAGTDAAQQRRMQQEQAQQAAQLHGLQIQGLQGDLQDKSISRQQNLDAQKFLQDYNARASSPTSFAQSVLGNDLAPTVENAAKLTQAQGATPSGGSGNSTEQLFNSRLAQAAAMRATGNPLLVAQADKLEETALKFQPKYSTDFRVARGDDGKLHNFILADNGSWKDTGLAVAPKLRELNLGGTTQLIDDNSATPGQIFQRTQTPDSLASNAISRERLAFDKSQAEDGTGPLSTDAILNAAKRYNFDGTLPQMGMGKSAAAGRSAILNKAAELAGDTGVAGGRDSQLNNKGDVASRNAAVKAFDSGKYGNTVKSFNVSIAHLDTLDKLSDALGNRDLNMLNKVGNYYAQQTGNPAPTNFNAAKKIVGDEIVKAIVGSGGGVADREEAARTIDAANSPAQLKAVIKTYQDLMVGQLGGLEQQYRVSTKRDDFGKYLSGRAQEIYQSHQGGAPAGGGAKTATLADIAETARKSGRSTAEVTKALKDQGYTIGGQ